MTEDRNLTRKREIGRSEHEQGEESVDSTVKEGRHREEEGEAKRIFVEARESMSG